MDRTPRKLRTHVTLSRSAIAVLLLALATLFVPPDRAQDNILTGTSSGVTSIRIAVADFKPLAADPQTAAFRQTFDATLYADLASAGIFDIVSKSLMPPGSPGAPAEVQLQSSSNAPAATPSSRLLTIPRRFITIPPASLSLRATIFAAAFMESTLTQVTVLPTAAKLTIVRIISPPSLSFFTPTLSRIRR